MSRKTELQNELEDIREMTESAESVDELRVLVKSMASVARRSLEDDVDDDEDGVDSDGDGYDQDDDDDKDGVDSDGDGRDYDQDNAPPRRSRGARVRRGSSAPSLEDAPVGRVMNKSLSEAVHEEFGATGEVDAGPIIEALSEGLLENNKQGHQNFELIKSIHTQLQTLAKGLGSRLDAIEDEFDLQRPMIKSAADFVDGIRRTPSGTVSASADSDARVSPSQVMQKSIPGGELEDGAEETYRGLTRYQLTKGLGNRLTSVDGDTKGLDMTHLERIDRIPLSEIDPRIAEVAAEELGLTLTN